MKNIPKRSTTIVYLHTPSANQYVMSPDKFAPYSKAAATLEPVELREFFLEQLNRVYCAKFHMLERLPEIEDVATFNDLKPVIHETAEQMRTQVNRIEEIYPLLSADACVDDCPSLTDAMEDAFMAIQLHDSEPALRDMCILMYLQYVESVELSCFRMLDITANRLHNPRVTQLIRQNYDVARNDRALFSFLMNRYAAA